MCSEHPTPFSVNLLANVALLNVLGFVETLLALVL